MVHFDWRAPIAWLFAIGAVTLFVAWVILEWRSDRATLLETLAILIVFIGGAFAADVYIGEGYRWLALGPPAIWFTLRWLVGRPWIRR